MERANPLVVDNLRAYITAENKDARLYEALSEEAPTDLDRQLLEEFAADEQEHANRFEQIYHQMTGSWFQPEIPAPVLEGSFADILRERVLDESADYRKYGEQYLQTTNDMALKNAYYLARTDANVHAIRLLQMLSGL